jgi:RimJ/RimL family protein N-acetyltransferase
MATEILLRDPIESDLPIFFAQQLDPEANAMAAFPARDEDAFMTHWHKILRNDTGIIKTILYNDAVAGNVVCWAQDQNHLVGYWLGKEFWGKGIATAALSNFLTLVPFRPLTAHVVKHNLGSIRVLEKCGFLVTGEESFIEEGREINELILTLS